MVDYRKFADEISQELNKDENILALVLYGSVARHEECENSDIDLLAIVKENHLQKRHEIRNGITVEFVEESIDVLRKFIAENEIPMFFALAEGILLFDKNSGIEELINTAKNIIANGPPVTKRWEEEHYRTKRRSDLTEIYMDLLDIEDEISFNYVASLLITNSLPLLFENNNLWLTTRKRTISLLRKGCIDGYMYIETLLSPICSLVEKRNAAEKLTECALKPYGGILKGNAILFKKNNFS